MLKKGTGFWIHKIPFFSGRPEIIPHLVNGNGNYVIHIKNRYTPLEILKGVFDTIVNLFPCPNISVFKILKDIYLPGSICRDFDQKNSLWMSFIGSGADFFGD